jgi:hypothetical protein
MQIKITISWFIFSVVSGSSSVVAYMMATGDLQD